MALYETNFNFPGQTAFYRGKVRDVYTVGSHLIMIASDRISAFDHILPKPIPHKGQVLNQTASYFLNATRDIVPNWLIANPDPNVAIGLSCEPVKLEMVVRGYLAGHAWREYRAGKRSICGVQMPEGLRESDPLPEPIITPATKAESGHDEDISADEILTRGIVDGDLWDKLCAYTQALFARGTEMAARQGLILVDTKYEFGLVDDTVYLIDEIHTPDSSRYYYADGYQERQERGEHQKQLSKEFVREWLMGHGFQGLDGQQMPVMPESFVHTVTERYIELYETVTGKAFERSSAIENISDRIDHNIRTYFGWE
ncbi:MAG: phosphoribosylaminoimidazolesuccinocarboxamide synthase [Saprospiraceae bacterium]|nr:phosphoribosylaminoimidazolesuccinocarboxamide synthase [Saprospiraceae bacterium]